MNQNDSYFVIQFFIFIIAIIVGIVVLVNKPNKRKGRK